MKRPCLRCGMLTDLSYCPQHWPTSSNPARGSGAQRRKFRKRTLAPTGGRCSVFGCFTPFDRVQAHHVHALADGGDPRGRGVPLCHNHHKLATAAERRRRALRSY